ncbi:MAG TPA: vitamin B12-dependent ribonucleotide reductase [Oligoflexia bacterium]|nr:vitamin B12-dependent ribonucleotide reductase [Oligoflexia bacterium]HMR25292.1 vitamin B12-dependent ribonucleotide reductase [Oligoflexia bacterium]
METSAINRSTPNSSSRKKTTQKKTSKGLNFKRYFTQEGVHPFDAIEWETREALIANEKGEVVFSQKNVEVPKFWSMLATNVVVSKYFRGTLNTPSRETSVKQLISRVAKTMAAWAKKQNYFASTQEAEIFEDELTHLLVHQKMAFNSPVWFNVGVEEHPQCSACFINSVDDSMASILDLAKTEGMLFKGGSGTGTNFSSIRSSKEGLAGGGEASGPVSFMKGYDAFAGVIKSGGKTRRAAKMVILNVDHPDIVDFIQCKELEEKKAWALIDAGYDGSFNGPAYGSVFFQNSNNSVRVTDEYMRALEEDRSWTTLSVVGKKPVETMPAKEIMQKIAQSAWICGDPGLQFDSTINDWHTCPNTDRIHASNPCSEYMFLNDTACNLASLNLMKYVSPDGKFDVESFRHAARTTILAQEIIVDNASYPTPMIEKNSHDYRPLGIGYANLGALLMSMGLGYDSDEGRAHAAAITAILSGHTYKTSAEVAADKEPFAGYANNREPMLKVIRKHADAVNDIDQSLVDRDLYLAAQEDWEEAYSLGKKYGFRNSQISVLAPTGTIGFMMDCDTTGVEPDIALVKYKKLVGGGYLKIVNTTVPMALKKLGYDKTQREDILAYIEKEETIEGAPHITAEHTTVFDCAFKPMNGERSIHYMGHLKMMGAVQPFISGAISKTVNLPNTVTEEEIAQAYIDSWKMGLKAVAVYRDGCKRSQPLNTSMDNSSEQAKTAVTAKPYRKHLPDERQSITHKFSVGGYQGYITVGMFEDGNPGEIFLVISKEGTIISGMMDSFATAISLALQYGVPLRVLIDKFSHTRFEPSGMTSNKEIPFAKSLVDYIFRWMASKFLSPSEKAQVGILSEDAKQAVEQAEKALNTATTTETSSNAVAGAELAHDESNWSIQVQQDTPPCTECGSMTIRSGVCYKCQNCGATSGCS